MSILSTYGGGVNSTAMMVEAYNRGISIDLILFSDTGCEKPETYQYIEYFDNWLINHGMPKITVVKKAFQDKRTMSLYEHCLSKNMLPSIAYGYKTCSLKWKAAPIQKYCNNYKPFKEQWKKGEKIVKYIGIDAGEAHRAKGTPDNEAKKFNFEYPLCEWDIDRDGCKEIIIKAGLVEPPKSSCFFCPSSTINEIRILNELHPDLMNMALILEANAELTKVKGLGRRFAWKKIIDQPDMFNRFKNSLTEIPCECMD